MKNRGLIVFFLAFLFLAAVVSGCAGPLKHKAAKDLGSKGIRIVAVLPVVMDRTDIGDAAEKAKISGLFLKYANAGLISRGYSPLSQDSLNSEFALAVESNKRNRHVRELIKDLKLSGVTADAVLLINISEWKTSIFATRASFKAVSEYYLIAKDGSIVWSAVYDDSEADYRIDKETLEFGMIKAYEARLEKSSSLAFSKLPAAPLSAPSSESGGGEGYFDWLK